jgi:hypothetical protein
MAVILSSLPDFAKRIFKNVNVAKSFVDLGVSNKQGLNLGAL